MSQYLVQTTLVANHTISFKLLLVVIKLLWGPYLVYKRILKTNEQLEHAVDYFMWISRSRIKKSVLCVQYWTVKNHPLLNL